MSLLNKRRWSAGISVPLLIYALSSLLLLAIWAELVAPLRVGDSDEYLLMVQAWSAHGSPDIRAADIEAHRRLLERNGDPGRAAEDAGFFLRDALTIDDGRSLLGHFWLYSLLAVPLWRLLRLTGGNEMAVLQTMNMLWFSLAAGLVLFNGRARHGDRLWLLGLAGIGPVIWYIHWPHPEVFTWSMALAAVHLLREERFGWAALAASLGALQNLPLILLSLLAVIMALLRRDRRGAACAAAAAALSFIPSLFSLWQVGEPHLLAGRTVLDYSLISPGRAWGVLVDLNQGILPYMPLTLLLGLIGGGMAVWKKHVRGILILAVLLVMVVLVGPQRNWNAGSAGMIRYAVWMVPLLAWLAVEFVPRGRRIVWVALAGLLFQAWIVTGQFGGPDYRRHSAPARFVLTHLPRLYSPDPQIFVERQLGHDMDRHSWSMPVPFVTASGEVTKVLVDRETHSQLREYFRVEMEGAWLDPVGRESDGAVYYLHPPPGKLRVVEPEGMDPKLFAGQLFIRLARMPETLSDREFEIVVEVTNRGPYRYWGLRACPPHPLKLGYRVHCDGEVVATGRGAMPFVLLPYEMKERRLRVRLPDFPGVYQVTVGTLLERLAWSESTDTFTVDSRGIKTRVVRGSDRADERKEQRGRRAERF